MNPKNIKIIDISQVTPDDKNFNKGTEFGYSLIEESLRKFGAGRSILIDKKGKVIAGNKTLEQAGSIGINKIVVVPTDGTEIVAVQRIDVDLDSKFGREMALADNATALYNISWDKEELEKAIQDTTFTEEDFKNWGLSTEELKSLLDTDSEAEEETFIQEDEIEKIDTAIQTGDLIEIGDHRLVCGDCRSPETVSLLLNDNTPCLMVTDPPYGVNYEPDWRGKFLKEKAGRAVHKIINDENSDWTEAFNLSPSKVAYIWNASLTVVDFYHSLENANFETRSLIVWVKNNHTLSRGHYHHKHELCWYAVKKGAKAQWIGGSDQTTVWHINKPSRSETGHSTQKPLSCMSIPIQNHKGDVYDPFIGSGTTMHAAHQLRRKCYAIDINPKCCQVVINRMRQIDPSIPVKINGKDYDG